LGSIDGSNIRLAVYFDLQAKGGAMKKDVQSAYVIGGAALLGLLFFKYKCLISEWFKLGLCATHTISYDPVGSNSEEEIDDL